MDKDLLIDNILMYCKARDEPPTKACINAGAGKDLIVNIRKGQTPSVAKVAQLAAYLGVSTSDLVGDARDDTSLTAEQRELLKNYAAASPELRAVVMAALAGHG